MSIVYLITGANRGLGKGYLQVFLSRPNTTVIAAVRDPSSASSQSLTSLPTGTSSKLILVKIDARSNTDAPAAAKELEAAGITHIDVLLANAGICSDVSRVENVELDVVQEHIDVNVYGTLRLFRAFLPLLVESKAPKFVALGSPLGSVTGMEKRPMPAAAYGGSKALLHWYMRKISLEHTGITTLVVDPGFVKTEMGNTGARAFGMAEAFVEIQDSVDPIVKIIDEATREKEGLVMSSFDGTVFPW